MGTRHSAARLAAGQGQAFRYGVLGRSNETGTVAAVSTPTERQLISDQRIPWPNSVRNRFRSLVPARLLRISEPQAMVFDGYGASEDPVSPVAKTTSSRQFALSASASPDGRGIIARCVRNSKVQRGRTSVLAKHGRNRSHGCTHRVCLRLCLPPAAIPLYRIVNLPTLVFAMQTWSARRTAGRAQKRPKPWLGRSLAANPVWPRKSKSVQ